MPKRLLHVGTAAARSPAINDQQCANHAEHRSDRQPHVEPLFPAFLDRPLPEHDIQNNRQSQHYDRQTLQVSATNTGFPFLALG